MTVRDILHEVVWKAVSAICPEEFTDKFSKLTDKFSKLTGKFSKLIGKMTIFGISGLNIVQSNHPD